MTLTPYAQIIKDQLHQSCTVAPLSSYDENGEAVYGAAVTTACRIVPNKSREKRTEGDIHGGWGTTLVFAADSAVTDKSQITMTDLAGYGAITAKVVMFYDDDGSATHKEAYI